MTSRRDFLKLVGLSPAAAPAVAMAAIEAASSSEPTYLIGSDFSHLDYDSFELSMWRYAPSGKCWSRTDWGDFELSSLLKVYDPAEPAPLTVEDQMLADDLFEPEAIISAS